MKKISIAILLLIFLSINTFSQNSDWTLYPSLGIDIGGAIPFPFSDIPEKASWKPKLNLRLGIGYEYKLFEKWFLALEVNYNTLEFSSKAEVRSQPFYQPGLDGELAITYFTGYTKADVELRQIEFPLVVTFRAGKNWAIPFGVYYSRILEGKFETEGTDGYLSDNKEDTDNAVLPGYTSTSYSFNDNLDSYDYGILFGYRYNLNRKLFFWGKFHVGFKSIFKKEFYNIDYDMYQVRVSIGASYNLFHSEADSKKSGSEEIL